MKPNLDKTSKTVRITFAGLMAILFFSGHVTGIPGIILIVVSVLLFATGMMRFCPIATVSSEDGLLRKWLTGQAREQNRSKGNPAKD